MALASLNTGAVANKGRAIALLHPSHQTPIGIRFYALGFDSKEAKRILREQENDRLAKQKKNRGKLYLPTAEETEENGINLLVGLTTGWDEDIVDDEGKVTGVRDEIELNPGQLVKFSPDAVRAIYKDLGFSWIKEQMDIEIGERRDFLPSESQN
ncbi:MAG: hypothetical protein A2076_13180 [Geobacteraceae bacterium GWC2_53_11]|nr:MAG: hypothetical protein A2076_13180 [Geobacteraceae bacterium GWC2_53_11]